jgi:hypothetical protein
MPQQEAKRPRLHAVVQRYRDIIGTLLDYGPDRNPHAQAQRLELYTSPFSVGRPHIITEKEQGTAHARRTPETFDGFKILAKGLSREEPPLASRF